MVIQSQVGTSGMRFGVMHMDHMNHPKKRVNNCAYTV